MRIYVLFSCNCYKSKDSMRLISATTNAELMKKIIFAEVAKEDMEFTSNMSGIGLFWYNDYLKYGHIEILDDGEVL